MGYTITVHIPQSPFLVYVFGLQFTDVPWYLSVLGQQFGGHSPLLQDYNTGFDYNTLSINRLL